MSAPLHPINCLSCKGTRVPARRFTASPTRFAVLAGLSYALTLPIFEPRPIWPLAYVAFVPLLAGLRLAEKSRYVYAVSFVFAMAFWCTHWRWLFPPLPIIGIVASLSMTVHMLPAFWAIRHLTRSRRLPMTLVFPIVWTADELFRSIGTFTFPWFQLAHTQVRVPLTIQIADLGGAYAISFVVAAVNGLIADLVIDGCIRGVRLRPSRPLAACTLATTALVAGTLAYGRFRLDETRVTDGPRVAIVQGDFPARPLRPATNVDPPQDDELDARIRGTDGPIEADKRLSYLRIIRQAGRAAPDLILLPEMPWSIVVNGEFLESPQGARYPTSRLQNDEFARLSECYGSTLVVGGMSRCIRPPGDYPPKDEYESAFVYTPGRSQPERHDKTALVLFGEYLPFRYHERWFWLYRMLNDEIWNPWGCGGVEYSVTPGTRFTRFTLPRRDATRAPYRTAVSICFEDAVPHMYRRFVVENGRKCVDFMLSISNSGAFGHSTQQSQHLAICTLRAVENRVWIARAANTGVSGFITSTGSWYDLLGEFSTEPLPGGSGTRTATAQIDARVTVYSRFGDWLAWPCLILATAGLVDSLALTVVRRWRRAAGH